jgi:hypothetical protein
MIARTAVAPSSLSASPKPSPSLAQICRASNREYLAALEMISFCRSGREGAVGRNFWAPPAVTDINQQWIVGDAFGCEALQFMARYEERTGENQFFLGHVVAAMISRGSKTGMELGFARAIERAAIRGMLP